MAAAPFFPLRDVSLIDGLEVEIQLLCGTPIFFLHDRGFCDHLRRIPFEVLRREWSPRVRYLSACHPHL